MAELHVRFGTVFICPVCKEWVPARPDDAYAEASAHLDGHGPDAQSKLLMAALRDVPMWELVSVVEFSVG